MKVGTLSGDNVVTSFFASMKIWLYVGWFIGIFPMRYDKTLLSFKYKFLSFTTFFAFCRLFLIGFGPLVPGLVFTILEDIEDCKENIQKNKTCNFGNVSRPMYQLNITDISLYNTSDNWWLNGEFEKFLARNKVKDAAGYLSSKVELFVPFLGLLGSFHKRSYKLLQYIKTTFLAVLVIPTYLSAHLDDAMTNLAPLKYQRKVRGISYGVLGMLYSKRGLSSVSTLFYTLNPMI